MSTNATPQTDEAAFYTNLPQADTLSAVELGSTGSEFVEASSCFGSFGSVGTFGSATGCLGSAGTAGTFGSMAMDEAS